MLLLLVGLRLHKQLPLGTTIPFPITIRRNLAGSLDLETELPPVHMRIQIEDTRA